MKRALACADRICIRDEAQVPRIGGQCRIHREIDAVSPRNGGRVLVTGVPDRVIQRQRAARGNGGGGLNLSYHEIGSGEEIRDGTGCGDVVILVRFIDLIGDIALHDEMVRAVLKSEGETEAVAYRKR